MLVKESPRLHVNEHAAKLETFLYQNLMEARNQVRRAPTEEPLVARFGDPVSYVA